MKKFITTFSQFKNASYTSAHGGAFGNLNFCWTSHGWLNLWDDEVKNLTHLQAQPTAYRIYGTGNIM